MALSTQELLIRIRADSARAAKQIDDLGSGVDKVGRSADDAKDSLASMGRFAVGAFSVGALAGMARAITEAGLAAEKLNRQLQFTAGPAAGQELEYLRNITARLGLEFSSAAGAYGKLAAAANGTALAGEKTRSIFEGVSKAAVTLGLSAAEVEGTLLAVQQMISKGTVQAEELRGQLGERLPGAFQIAARSMGVTTSELGKMLELGQVTAEDFLPKFAAELNKTFGDSSDSAAASAQAGLNRLSNAWTDFKRALAEGGGLEAAAAGAEKLATIINAFNWSPAARLADKLREIRDLNHEIGVQQSMGADTSGMELRVRILQDEVKALQEAAKAQRDLNLLRNAPAAQSSREMLRDSERKINDDAAKPGRDYVAARKSPAQKMQDEIAAEMAAFSALHTKTREAEEANQRALAAIREKYSKKVGAGKTAGESAAERKARYDAHDGDGRSALEVMRELHKQDAIDDRAAESRGREVKQIIDMIDPLQKYREQLERIRELKSTGDLTGEQALEAEWAVQERITGAMKDPTEAIREQKDVARELGMTFSSAFEDAVIGGKKFSEVLHGLAQDIQRIIMRKTITEPLGDAVGQMVTGSGITDWFSGLLKANATGGVYASPGLSAYSGRIVDKPTLFPFAKGIGLMGEAGPEAILPLKRGAGGRLGVEAGGGAQSIRIEVVNQAQQPVRVDSSNVGFDAQGMVVKMFLADMRDNGPMRQSLGGLGLRGA